MVSYSPQSRRLAVGAKSGQLALYDLRSSRCQVGKFPLPRFGQTATDTGSVDQTGFRRQNFRQNKSSSFQISNGPLAGVGRGWQRVALRNVF